MVFCLDLRIRVVAAFIKGCICLALNAECRLGSASWITAEVQLNEIHRTERGRLLIAYCECRAELFKSLAEYRWWFLEANRKLTDIEAPRIKLCVSRKAIFLRDPSH